MNLRTRIASTYIFLTVAGIALAGIISSWQIRNYIEHRSTEALRAQVELMADLFTDGSLSVDSTGAQDAGLRRRAMTLGVRLTLIGKDGVVRFDSKVSRDSLSRMENHGARPEVIAARRQGMGMDRRLSATVREEFLYAAKMLRQSPDRGLDSAVVRLALGSEELQTIGSRVQLVISAVGCVAILIIILVSLRVSRNVTRPILSIVSTAQAIRDGDLHKRVVVRPGDEIAGLATAINEMAETLSKDIERFRKLERVRSEFLGNVSHELRTPIFSIQGFLETLIDGAIDDPSVNRDFLAKALRHAERLNALLNDLIEISRIESGEMKMSFRYFSVTEFLTHVVDELRPAAAKKEIALSVAQLPPAAEQVYGDKERLKQVMVNLIDNAVKYTEPGGKIDVRAVLEPARCTIAVRDTGCGIPPTDQSRIFERFYRVDKDRSRDVGGTGLGLAIVKHIVEAHGGTISVVSEPGNGSEFAFTVKR